MRTDQATHYSGAFGDFAGHERLIISLKTTFSTLGLPCVAKCLECDEDRGRFEANVSKLAKASPKPK